MATKIWNEFIPQFGFPAKIHHDQGTEFNNNLWKELHRCSGVVASNTTPYHPQGNGMVERLNRTAQNMLKAIPEREKKRWKEHLPKLAFAYNTTVNKSTGYSPFFLMFGRHPRLPVDSIFGLDPAQNAPVEQRSHSQFVDDWKRSMEQAFQLANQNIEKSAEYNKQHYDKKIHGNQLKINDQVLVRNVREKGGKVAKKLKSHWERNIFKIVEKKENLPVYVIENVNNKKDKRTVHRNLLMECNDLPKHVFDDDNTDKVNKKQVKKKDNEIVQDSEENEDENVVVFVHEDVANSLLGGGDGADNDMVVEAGDSVEIGGSEDNVAVPELVEVETETDLDDTFPYEETDAEIQDDPDPDPDSDGDGNSQPLRKSGRTSRTPKIFTYDKVGGPPVLVDVRCQLFPT